MIECHQQIFKDIISKLTKQINASVQLMFKPQLRLSPSHIYGVKQNQDSEPYVINLDIQSYELWPYPVLPGTLKSSKVFFYFMCN